MPKVYTVQTDNAFSALYDASDNEEVILSSVPAHLQEQPESTQVQRPRREKEERPPTDKRGPRPVRREDGERRPPRNEQLGEEDGQAEGRNHIRNRERRVGPKPEGQTDKASGTGRGKELKKDGGGAHGWGNQNEDHGGDQGWKMEQTPAQEGEEGVPEEGAAPPKEATPAVVSYAEYQKQENREVAALSEKPVVKSQRAVEDGCQVYTKAHEQEVKTAAKDAKDTSKSGKAIHLTELAAQSGVAVRYSGDDKRRNNPRGGQDRNTQEREGVRERSNAEHSGEVQPKNTPAKEIKLDDNNSFPSIGHS